jgi:hypothetical protein
VIMKTTHVIAAALLAATAASPAFAQWRGDAGAHPESRRTQVTTEEAATGFSFGLRAAYAMPGGALGAGTQVSDVTFGAVPAWVEAGYRFNRNLSAGLFLQYNRGFSANCPAQASCSTSDLRFGVEGTYSFMPSSTFSPWAGLGAGYEMLSWSRAGAEASAKGFEYANLQAGMDWNVASNYAVGPFATMTFGKFSSQSSGGVSTSFTDSGMHSWLQFGLKLTYRM